MIWYAIASLTPAALLALACLFGRPWPLAALLSITVLVLRRIYFDQDPRHSLRCLERQENSISRGNIPLLLMRSSSFWNLISESSGCMRGKKYLSIFQN